MSDEIDFNTVEAEPEQKELTLDDFKGGSFLKNPAVGQEITFVVDKIVESKNITMKNKVTGKEFTVGLKQKDGKIKRYDIHTNEGIYTISNWEIFFKTLGNKGVLKQYAEKSGTGFKGAKIVIKKLLDGGHANYKVEDLAMIMNKPLAEALAYQESIKKAIKEQRLYEVRLI